ncbi:MAG TPA: DUF58 domain-containing protein [Bryobacteraceae bacterium]|nr:DUF58 domain-containing protein [Bryobacteraceae bacterium]
MPAEPLLETALLEKLERLTIQWQKSLPGLVGGHHASHFAGPGQEFLDHRNFHHGDDLRAINWRVYLRLEKLFLKMFQLEPRIPVRLLFDVSSSMQTGAISKFDYVRKLTGALCYVGLVRLDSICLQPFSDRLGDAFIAGGGRHRFQPAVNFLSSIKPGGKTNFLEVSRQFVSTYPQRGLAIVISDFLDDGECEKPLQYLSDFGHDIILVHIWAPEDREPPWEGELELEDAETGQHVELSFDSEARAMYTTAFDEYAQALRRVALRNNGRYVGVPTDVPVDEAIFGPIVHAGAME